MLHYALFWLLNIKFINKIYICFFNFSCCTGSVDYNNSSSEGSSPLPSSPRRSSLQSLSPYSSPGGSSHHSSPDETFPSSFSEPDSFSHLHEDKSDYCDINGSDLYEKTLTGREAGGVGRSRGGGRGGRRGRGRNFMFHSAKW